MACHNTVPGRARALASIYCIGRSGAAGRPQASAVNQSVTPGGVKGSALQSVGQCSQNESTVHVSALTRTYAKYGQVFDCISSSVLIFDNCMNAW